MPVCTECGSAEIQDSICQNCGAHQLAVTESVETPGARGQSVTKSVRMDSAVPAASSAPNRRRSTLRPIDEQIAPPSQFSEEATDAGQDFPRLSTDAFIGEDSSSDVDEVLLELTDLVTEPPSERALTEPVRETPSSPTGLETCGNCGKESDFSASIFCDHCGVRTPKRGRVGKTKDSGKVTAGRSRPSSKLVQRCKLCGYTVPSGSPACQNCGTPVH